MANSPADSLLVAGAHAMLCASSAEDGATFATAAQRKHGRTRREDAAAIHGWLSAHRGSGKLQVVPRARPATASTGTRCGRRTRAAAFVGAVESLTGASLTVLAASIATWKSPFVPW